MGLDRVSAFGHSWGGYGVLRAMLLEPGLYRVGVASAPSVDLDRFHVSIEPYMGCLKRPYWWQRVTKYLTEHLRPRADATPFPDTPGRCSGVLAFAPLRECAPEKPPLRGSCFPAPLRFETASPDTASLTASSL